MAVDPKVKTFESPYVGMANSPIVIIDPNGEDGIVTILLKKNEMGKVTAIKIIYEQTVHIYGESLDSKLHGDNMPILRDRLLNEGYAQMQSIKNNTTYLEQNHFSDLKGFEGISITFDYNVKLNVINDTSNKKLIKLRNEHGSENKRYYNFNNLPQEMKEEIGFSQGDNSLTIFPTGDSGRGWGQAAYVNPLSLTSISSEELMMHYMAHEIFHLTGVTDLHNTEGIVDGDYMTTGQEYKDVLVYGAVPSKSLFIHKEHFKNLTINILTRFYNGTDVIKQLVKAEKILPTKPKERITPPTNKTKVPKKK